MIRVADNEAQVGWLVKKKGIDKMDCWARGGCIIEDF